MHYLITFFKERFYNGNEYTVLKPYRDVHLSLLFITLLIWGPNIVIQIVGFITNGFEKMFSTNIIPSVFIILLIIEVVLLITFEGQYVKISNDEIKVVEFVFFKKTMNLADITEREIVSGGVGFRIASKYDEIIIKIFHLSKHDIDILYKKVGYVPKQCRRN